MTNTPDRPFSLLLVHAPLAKACEPPGGLARLAGALRQGNIRCHVWDANIEGQLALLGITAGINKSSSSFAKTISESGPAFDVNGPEPIKVQKDRWLIRSSRHLDENLELLRSDDGYRNHDRYRRAVMDLNHLLAVAGRPFGVRMSLADYQDGTLSPLRSADLLIAATVPEKNPFYEWFCQRLPSILKEDSFGWAGFSLNYLSQALTTFAMIGFLRREYPSIRIVVGGGLITSWMRSPNWRNPFSGLIDKLVSGPGEIPLLRVAGVTSAPVDGNFSLPDYDGFLLDRYLAPGLVLPYSASGGCWWRRCSFCPEVSEGNPYLPIHPGRVVADLRHLVEGAKPKLIHMLDNALSPSLLDAFIASPPGAPWYGFARVDARLADIDFCERLRDSGCVMLKLGIESGDQGVLDALRKGIDLTHVAAALKNLKEVGIAVYVYLLFGTPAENRHAALKTLAFVEEHADEISFLNLAIFNLPAFSAEAAQYALGEFYEGDLSLYRPFIHPQGWGRKEVRRFLDAEFKRNPAIGRIVSRDPPFFTSNHAPFLIGAVQER